MSRTDSGGTAVQPGRSEAGCVAGHTPSYADLAAPPVVEVAGLWFSYDGAAVLEDVSLQVALRDFVCIIGPNGGGKTTLLRLILGLLQPERGTLRVFGQSPHAARRRIGYMPQRAQLDPQFPVTVRDVVLMGCLRPLRVGPFGRVERRVALEALEEVGLADLAGRPFAALSGGQRQRVLIARALACKPDLLLLDEPSASLDPLVQGDLNELLVRLNQRLTIVIVSHDVGFVAQHVRNVVCVNRRVTIHSASHISGESIRNIYGHDVHVVHHGDCSIDAAEAAAVRRAPRER